MKGKYGVIQINMPAFTVCVYLNHFENYENPHEFIPTLKN